MSTIGHPLSDLANLVTPFYTATLDPTKVLHAHKGFLPNATPGIPTPSEIAALYFSTFSPPSPSSSSIPPSLSSSQDRELQWAQAFNIFRQAAICQGIAARIAARQASSEEARRYADARVPLADFAWELVLGAGGGGGGKARL